MRLSASTSTQSARERVLVAAGIAVALSLCFAVRARADALSAARNQFARAVTMRTMLEGYLEKDRSLADYKKTVAAYHKVYRITPRSEDCTASFMAEGELYEEMGRLYGAKYYASAIGAYRFLLKQYPGSRFRGSALLTIARIQKDDLHDSSAAQGTYKQYLRLFPRSEKAHEVLADLREVTTQDANLPPAGAAELPQLPGKRVKPRASNRPAYVTSIHTSNAGHTTRIVVLLNRTIRYTAARISSPDRIYFDLYRAQLSRTFSRKTLDVPDGLIKSVRVAQNRQGVVRIVLDVKGAKDYSSYLLGKPYRLVIDVNGPSTATKTVAHLVPPVPPKPTREGNRSLARVLDLKVRRIVIDPGHGGHDTGTIGPHGLKEKDVCLDIALRLGRLIKQKLPGAQVIYTRKTDVFVPLEERTAIANRAHADLFVSIHANSSHDRHARGVETYYLNFATSREAMAVAARENAASEMTQHDLPDLLKKIARNDKIEESKELAQDIQESLSHRLERVSRHERNRGVKKAPFVVLIGANMPSVLVETSFLSNPTDEHLLRSSVQRQRIAVGLYRGIATYLKSLNSLTYDKQKIASDRQRMTPLEAAAAVAPARNSK